MSFYRVKQFIWAVTARFKPVNKELPKRYLSGQEQQLFDKLMVSDQHHSIRVCKDALNRYEIESMNIDKGKLARIALLHDVGKSEKSLNAIDKSVLVILNKLTKGNLKKYTKYKKIDAYYNHPKKSLKLLNNVGYKYDNEFLEAVEKHHYKNIGSNIYLKIIKECDDNN